MLLNYEQRNSDFLKAVRAEARRCLGLGRELHSLVRQAPPSPAPSDYITTDYAWNRLRDLRCGHLGVQGIRRDMLVEIAGRLAQSCRQNPTTDPYALLDDIVGSEASRFFLSEQYALRLFTGSARNAAARTEAARRSIADPLPRVTGHRRRAPHSRP